MHFKYYSLITSIILKREVNNTPTLPDTHLREDFGIH